MKEGLIAKVIFALAVSLAMTACNAAPANGENVSETKPEVNSESNSPDDMDPVIYDTDAEVPGEEIIPASYKPDILFKAEKQQNNP